MTTDTVWIVEVKNPFLQMELAPEDAETVCFMQSGDPEAVVSALFTYAWKKVTFGLTSSPFLKAVILKHAALYERQYPEAVQLIYD